MEDFRQVVEHAQPLSVTLSRGQKGTYAWEIKARGVTPDEMREVLKDMDEKLKCDYLGEGVGPEAAALLEGLR